jgi:hypothetical protein
MPDGAIAGTMRILLVHLKQLKLPAVLREATAQPFNLMIVSLH